MSLRHTLTRRLNDTWHGAPWYGDSSDTILSGITAGEAAAHVVPGAHSIWQIVLHMTAWTETVGARVRGAGATAPGRGDWPAIGETTAAAWTQALADLQTARTALLGEVDATHEEDIQIHVKGYEPPFHDTGISRAGTVSGLIEHDVYHLGQVALLKRIIRANS